MALVLTTHPSRAQCLVGSFDAAGDASGIDVVGDTTFLACGGAGLLTFDTSNPAAPVPLGAWNPLDFVKDVSVAGDVAFVACSGANVDTLSVLDVSDPAAPTLIGAYDSSGGGLRLHVVGDRAYVAAGLYGGLQIFDISVPTAPDLLGSLDMNWPLDVHVVGSLAFVADDREGLSIVDVSDPTTPVLLSSTWYQGNALGVFASGTTAYVANGLSGRLVIVDATDPAAPTELGRFEGIQSYAREVVVHNDVAYVASHLAGLYAIDVSDPTAPRLVNTYDNGGSANGVVLREPHAFVSVEADGLQISDVFHCPCAPDLNGDGQVNTLDFIAFLGAWSAADPLADWNGDGAVNTIDFIEFLGDWAEGC